MDTKTVREMFDRVPDRINPAIPMVDYILQWILNRFREENYQYLEVAELSGEFAHEVVQILRTNLEPKGYRVSIKLARSSFYMVTIE